MQSASANYAAASSGAGGTWADPKLAADWAGDGYGGDASIDNLSLQAGNWTVEHHLDDGLPNSVTFIAGIGAATMTADIGPPPAYLTGNTPMTVAEYLSPYNIGSPVSGYHRDTAAVTLDHGVITASGPERVRVFTGQMTDMPVKSGAATMTALSATRLKLQKLVQPPAFARGDVGLNGSWPISWALVQSGVYVGPPSRTGCRWWVPMHGSLLPFLPDTNTSVLTFGQTPTYEAVSDNGTTQTIGPPAWVTGPYLLAPALQLTATLAVRALGSRLVFEAGTDFLSTAGNKCRFEGWVRGDATDVNHAPGGSGTVTRLCGVAFSGGTGARLASLGVDTARKVTVSVTDGAGHTASLSSSDTLPTDGVWYHVDCGYDVANKRLWVRNFDGSLSSSNASTLVTSSLPTADAWDDTYPLFRSYLPCAELQLTSGAQASLDNYPNGAHVGWTATAAMTPSVLELAALVETQPREAWEYISTFAQAELASMRTDENDIFNYLGLGWWVRTAQQAVVDLISTEVNAGTVDINVDPTKIRNTVRITYDLVEVAHLNESVFTLSSQVTIPLGTSTLTVTFSTPVTALYDDAFTFYNGTSPPTTPDVSFISLNTSTDGTGLSYDDFLNSGISIDLVSWDAGSAVFQFTNTTGLIWFTANSANATTLSVAGVPARTTSTAATASDTTSVALRGERSLVVSAGPVQTVTDALRLANRLKMALRNPVPAVEEFDVFGEARRQPGDLVTFADPSITRVSGSWRVQNVTHKWQVSGGSADYVNSLIVRPTVPIGVWGTGVWGACLWGENSTT